MVRLGAVQRGMARRDWASNGEAHMVRFQSDAIRLGAVQVVTARMGAVQVLKARVGAVQVLIARVGAVQVLKARVGAVQVVTARVGAVQVRLCDYVLNHAKAHAGAARLKAVRIEQV